MGRDEVGESEEEREAAWARSMVGALLLVDAFDDVKALLKAWS